MTRKWRASILALGLLCTSCIYASAIRNDFVEFDDDDYVYANPVVRQGLTWDGVVWAFTTGHAANYHPLTWLSHMADVSLFGQNPAGHHFTNLILHSLNVLLLFLFLHRSTGALMRSWCAAVVFSIHPLHVESVAWVSERKDLLCALFMLIASINYTSYLQNRSTRRYAAILLSFTLALLSKPMAVTLPFLFLLLDFWPYRRYADFTLGDTLPLRARRLVLEKTPLLLLALLSSVVTFIVQQRGGAMRSLEHLSLPTRLANGAVSYVRYLWKFFWPTDLSVIYPHPGESLAVWKVILACAVLAGISLFVWRERRHAPYLLMGWLWYAGMLVPVIGIIQVGYTAMADRYMYLPITGLALALIWGIADLLRRYPSKGFRAAVSVVGIFLAAALLYLTQRQTLVWRDSETLFKHAIAVTDNNAEAMTHLGVVYLRQSRPNDAIPPLEQATQIRPTLPEAWSSLGVAYRMSGRLSDSVNAQVRALQLSPRDPAIHTNLGYVYAQSGDFARAEFHLHEALRLDPAYEPARARLHELMLEMGTRNGANRTGN